LVPIDGKLYIRAGGDQTPPTIYELDYQKKVATELLDTRLLPKKSLYRGRGEFGLMAGPPGELLIWASPDSNPDFYQEKEAKTEGGDLFLMNVQNKSVRRSKEPFYSRPHVFYFSKRMQCMGYGTPDGAIAAFKPSGPSIEWLIPQKNHTLPKSKTSRVNFGHAGLAFNSRYLLASQKKVGDASIHDWDKYYNVNDVKHQDKNSFDWLLYERGNPNPRRLVAANLPPPARVKRFLINDQNQILMMTNKAVFRIELPADKGQ